jgi:glycine reductase complex component B subunit gamma
VGIPVVHVAALYHVANMVGSNRILKGEATTNPLGNPTLLIEKERALRRRYVQKALDLLAADVKEKTVFFLDPI